MASRARRSPQRKEKSLIVSIPRKRLQDAVNNDETTPKRFHADLGEHNEEEQQIRWERRSSCDSSGKSMIADPHMQSGTSEDEGAVSGDQSNDQHNELSGSECDEADISCQNVMVGFEIIQDQFLRINLEYKSVKSKYEEKCAGYKELEATNQKLNEEIRSLREHLKKAKGDCSDLMSERRKLREEMKEMGNQLQHKNNLIDILEERNSDLTSENKKLETMMHAKSNYQWKVEGKWVSESFHKPKLEKCTMNSLLVKCTTQKKRDLKLKGLDERFGIKKQIQCSQNRMEQDPTGLGQITQGESSHRKKQWFSEIDKSKLPPVSDELVVEFISGMAGCWDRVGVGLGVGEKVKCIRHSHGKPESNCLEVLQNWIERGKDVTWIKLLDVLEGLGLVSLADKIEQKVTLSVSA